MLNAVGWAAAILLAACLLRVILNGGRAGADRGGTGGTGGTRRALELLPLAAIGLTLWHGWLALHGSAFVVLFSLPGYLAAAILLAISLPRLRRAARAALAGNVRGTGSAEPAAASVRTSDGAGSDGVLAGPVLPSRRAAARVAAAAGLGLLVLSAVRLVELHALRNAATSPPELRRQERVLDLAARSWPDAFAALCADLAVRYPFTAWKGIDWRTRCAVTAPRIAAAAAHRDAAAYYGALREFVWSIPDGHVGLAGDDHGLAGRETGGDFGLRLVQLAGGRVVASVVLPGGAAARAGLRYGAEILTWNGKPIAQALAATPVLWADWPPATAEARRAEQLRFLVRAPVGTVASIAYRPRGAPASAAASSAAGSSEAPRTVRLTAAAPLPAASRKAGGTAPMDPDEPPEGGPVPFNLREAFTGGAVEWRWLPAGAGYIRVKYELPTLCQVDPSGQVRRAVASFLDRRASGIVLDVRGNGGGLDLMVPRAIGCLVDVPGVYEVPGVFSPAARRFLPAPAYTVRVVPMAPHFAGRVAVLIDGYTLSSGEGFPLALRGRPGVAVFGFAGTGGFFAIDQRLIRLPGGLAMVVPIGQSLGAGGRIQVDSDAAGRGGVAPDHLIPWTEATLDAVYREHRDPVLEAAVAWLRAGSY
ncbi:MAG TPA: S41 family peptidase [Thermoanaerobaculia bacterium]|jgi:carboxyl-terminal processing protease|nr:S41 family peptidase [Thermoanaerobaculia bacterium]